MSSAVVSTSAALGRPFVFDDEAAEAAPPLFSEAPKKPAGAQENPQQSALSRILQSTIKNQKSTISRVVPASRLEIRPAPEMVPTGIPALDALTGGLPRGCLTEICGPASSGRTTVLLAALAAATRRGEFCALIDASDSLDPHSAIAAGVHLDRLLWVRCGDDSLPKNPPQRHPSTSLRASSDTEEEEKEKEKQKRGCPILAAPFAAGTCPELAEGLGISQTSFEFDQRPQKKNAWNENTSRPSEHRLEQVLRATDLLLESGGFGLIVLDLADLPPQSARRIPLTTWFRFRRAIEHKPTILLAIEQYPIAGSCSSLLLRLGVLSTQYSVLSSNGSSLDQAAGGERDTMQELQPAHAQLFTGLEINAELIRSRLNRKPSHSITFATKTAWAG